MIGLKSVVRRLVSDMPGGGQQFRQDGRVHAGEVGGHLHRRCRGGQGLAEETAGRGQVTLVGQQHVDDLPVLVDCPLQIHPAPSDADVRFVDAPAVAAAMASAAGGVDQQRGERLHPAVDADVVDHDPAFGQQLSTSR